MDLKIIDKEYDIFGAQNRQNNDKLSNLAAMIEMANYIHTYVCMRKEAVLTSKMRRRPLYIISIIVKLR